jgi:RNA polymerase sigma-70 factor (ECF subfamily)
MPGREKSAQPVRPVVYCVIPRDLAPALYELLRRHFSDDPAVEVIVEMRADERRVAAERRDSPTAERPTPERRQIRSRAGRRVADRRAIAVAVAPPPLILPRRARAYAAQLTFFERLEPASRELEDSDTARIVLRIQGGELKAFELLYVRYFDRICTYERLLLRDRHAAEDATQQVFLQALQALPRYEHRGQPFRLWLFTIARNCALRRLNEQARLSLFDDETLSEIAHDAAPGGADLPSLGWITNDELMMFVERLPPAQRQAIFLRFAFDFSARQIAGIMDRSEDDVRALQSRALRFLRQRLEALGRDPRPTRRSRAVVGRRKLNVLRARRSALLG